MEKLIQKTSELHLTTGPRQPCSPGRAVGRSPHRASSRSTGRLSDTSGAIRSDDDFSSIGIHMRILTLPELTFPPGPEGEPLVAGKTPSPTLRHTVQTALEGKLLHP